MGRVRRVTVVGTGVIGASWTAFFLSQGLEVIATDPARDAEAFLRRFVNTAWPTLSQLDPAPEASPEKLQFTHCLERSLQNTEYVQENTPERQDLKVRLFAEIDKELPPDVIIATSSSGLKMTEIQSECRHPERCVVGHPFNPPHLIPLVEVVGGKKTSSESIMRAMEFYASLNKRPVYIRKEVSGHVANRLQAALWREAVYLVEQGVVSVSDIDSIVCWGPGLRWGIMGPNLLFHLAGGHGGISHFLDHLGGAFEAWWSELGTPVLTPELKQVLIDGVVEEVGNRPIEEFAEQRDVALQQLIKFRAMRKE